MNPLDVLLVALAAFYAANAITSTKGPWGCFSWLREHVPLGGLTTCFICATLWCAAAFYALNLFAQPVTMVFAAGGASVLLWRYTGADRV